MGTPDPLACYELTVQSPRHIVSMLRAIHGGQPIVLREDFCGSAAVATRWCKEASEQGSAARAVGVDLDAAALARAAAGTAAAGVADRVALLCADAVTCPPAADDGADIIFVGNFSIGYIHSRADLVAYLRRCRDRLSRGNAGFGGGVFICDLYGGAGAFRLGSLDRTHMGRGNEVIHYHWEHEAADPMTGLVTNSISFRVVVNGEQVAHYARAFVYHWRLWSLSELREALVEAGFQAVEFYKDLNLAPGEAAVAVSDPRDLGEDWVVMVAGR